MKICVLANPEGWHYLDLKRAAGADFQMESCSFAQLADVVETGSKHPLENFDCLLARAMPYGSLQQVIFRMDVLLALERRGVRIVNPPRAIEMSVDKYLSLVHLLQNDVAIPRTAVSQTFADAMRHFELLGGDVVMKPLFGSQGRGLERISSRKIAESRFVEVLAAENVVYQQIFIEHGGTDLRLLVIGNAVLAMKRVNPKNWITNIAQGATGIPHQANDHERELAIAATRAVGAKIAGVDLAYDRKTEQLFVLEINSAPAWQSISEVLQMDVANIILEFLASE